MIKEKNRSFEEISRLKKFTVITGIFVLLFGGMFAAIIAIYDFKNYDNPYLFGFTFGTIGLLMGLFIAKKIKSKILISQQMQQNYFQLTMYVAIGFIGLALLLGQKLNTLLSSKEKCYNYSVIDKEFRKGGYRRPELNILVINIDGVNHRYITNSNYWESVSVGQQINACIFKSQIGFDYIKLTDEK